MLMAENLLLMRRRYRSSVSAAALFLAASGPLGMVMDFADASMAIKSSGGALDYQSQGQVSNGALVGPGANTTYSAPSVKYTEQSDGVMRFNAHNLYLNNGSPANQSITVLSGASYEIKITGSVSITLSGAATGTVTAGTTAFTAATGTLTCGSTSGSGRVYVRRTPCNQLDIDTAGAAAYDLPYVWSGGVRQGIQVEPAATNLNVNSDFTSAAWTKRGTVSVTKNQTGPDGIANSACRVTGLGAAGANDIYETAYAIPRFTASQAITQSLYIRKVSASGVVRVVNASSGTLYYSIDFSLLGSGWERITPTHPAVTTGTLTATAGGIFGPQFVVTSGTLDFDLYAPQLETGTVATSPIITYGAAVARAADVGSVLGSLFPLSSSEGTLFVEVVSPSALPASTDARPASLNDGSNNNRAFMYATSGDLRFGVRSGGAASADVISGVIAPSTAYKAAGAYAVNDFAASLNGAAAVTDTSGAAPVGLTNLHVGYGSGATQWNGLIKRVAYFPRRLSNAELQAITA